MKAKKQDRILRELFRNKLEYAEIAPDPSVGVKLMRKLAVREFMHFNPFRFNIYYLGGIVAAVIATVLILSSAHNHKDHVQPGEMLKQLPVKNETEKIVVAPVQPTVTKNHAVKRVTGPAAGKKTVTVKEAVTEKAVVPQNIHGIRNDFIPDTPGKSLKTKELFNLEPEDNYKLHEMNSAGKQLFESSVGEGCAPLKVLFKNDISGYDSCLWTFGDGGSSTGINPEWIYDVEGDYKVVLKVFGPGGVISSYSEAITVFPRPTARFEIYPDKVSIPGNEVRFENYSSGAVRCLWSFGDGSTSEQFDPVHRYDQHGNFNISLKVYSENGCPDSLVVFNAFSGSSYFIEFPNAFIPNTGGPSGGVYSLKSDESAQVFHPSYSGVSEYHLKIFSKLGVLIFETNDINVGWDGYFKGQLTNPGVYIWKVRGNFMNGEPFTKMGDVTLLKN